VLSQHNSETSFDKGKQLYRDKKYSEAVREFSKAISKGDNLAKAYNNRGAAIRHLKLEEYGTLSSILGVNLSEVNEWYAAFKDFSEAIDKDEKLAEAWHNRGLIWFRDKNFEQATVHFNKAIEINPYFGLAYLCRGLIHREQGNWPEAEQNIEVAEKLGVSNNSSRSILAYIKLRQGKVFQGFTKPVTDLPKSTLNSFKFIDAWVLAE
jgi:tetratricopeptide (TPR) repeat protein